MNIETIKEFVEWSEGFPFVEVEEVKWCINKSEVYWVPSNSFEDEWEYSAEVLRGGVLRKDGLVLVNIDNGCGETITLVFLESMEVKN